MGLIDMLQDVRVWRAFLAYKVEKSHLAPGELEEWESFIDSGAFRPLAVRMAEPNFCFDPPKKRRINKTGSDKKRIVYQFGAEESRMLKLMAYLLYRYDGCMPASCYSFRRTRGAHHAIRTLANTQGISEYYCYKLDISDYFNSIDIARLLPILREVLADDPPLYAFLARLLTADEAIEDSVLLHEKRGVMAGTPISPFLANLYLMELDRHFEALGVPYARYSDDMIVFAPTWETLIEYRAQLCSLLHRYGLAVNPKKEAFSVPHAGWEFLGVRYCDGEIDLSHATKEKLKGKLRRKARALRRWMCRKGATPEQAMRAYIRIFNKKFFECSDANELTWARWFFPLLTVDTGLKEIDAYMQQCLRYIPTGRYGKQNYRTGYGMLKECGYRTLVNAYYAYRAGKLQLVPATPA